MAKYKMEFANGIKGKPDDLRRRLESLGGVITPENNMVEIADVAPQVPHSPEYINAILGEYGGTATVESDKGDDQSDPGDKAA